MANFEPRDGSFFKPDKVTPADRILAEIDGTYYRLSEVAEILNVSQTTLRRLLKNPDIKAPSAQARQGGMGMYLYSPEDIEELRSHFGKK